MFGPDTKPSRRMLDLFHEILEYNDGKRVMHKVGRFVNDRYTHRNRWVRAMRKTDVPMRLIDGPIDPNSGRHMAQRYLEVIPNPDVVMLDDNIGHWPQIEAPDAVLDAFSGAHRAPRLVRQEFLAAAVSGALRRRATARIDPASSPVL